MTCAKCGKQPVEKTIATKTSLIGDLVVVEEKRQALVCECGVLAWDPKPAPALNPFPHPYTLPLPIYPGLPRTPPRTTGPIYTQPNTAAPPTFTPWLPNITC